MNKNNEKVRNDFDQVVMRFGDFYQEAIGFDVSFYCRYDDINNVLGLKEVLENPKDTIYNEAWLNALPTKVFDKIVDECIKASVSATADGYLDNDTCMEHITELKEYHDNADFIKDEFSKDFATLCKVNV